MHPSVLVLILSYNGKELLIDAVQSYLDCEYPNFKVAVIDNGSTDGTEDFIRNNYPNVVFMRSEKNLGYSGGMNIGLAYAFEQNNYDYVLITNNDVIADKQIIAALVETATANPGTAFTTGKVYYYERPNVFQTVGKSSHPTLVRGEHLGRGEKDLGQYDMDTELAFCDDIFWLVSREVYLTTGGYDTDFFLQAEDFDWQLRAKKYGFKIMYSHKAKLWHKESMTIGKSSPLKAYYDARNPMIAIMKNCEPNVVKIFCRNRIFNVMLPSIARHVIKGHIALSYSMTKGLLSVLIWKIKHHKRQ
jgi:GT2 family glycosyltransferase